MLPSTNCSQYSGISVIGNHDFFLFKRRHRHERSRIADLINAKQRIYFACSLIRAFLYVVFYAILLFVTSLSISGKGQEYWQDERIIEEMPACRQMFNIFHPFDPVAYRVEPLVCKEYISKRPVIIPYHRGGKRLHIGFQEFREDLAARSQAIVTSLNVMTAKMVNVFQPRNKETVEAIEDTEVVKERTYGSLMMERLTGSMDGQIDHVLQDKTFEHPYISAIGAHTNYWRDPDTALFILKHLYHDIPEEPDIPGRPSSPESSTNRKGPTGPSYQSDGIDEDLPLTFSDKSLIREFSRKVRKSMRKR